MFSVLDLDLVAMIDAAMLTFTTSQKMAAYCLFSLLAAGTPTLLRIDMGKIDRDIVVVLLSDCLSSDMGCQYFL